MVLIPAPRSLFLCRLLESATERCDDCGRTCTDNSKSQAPMVLRAFIQVSVSRKPVETRRRVSNYVIVIMWTDLEHNTSQRSCSFAIIHAQFVCDVGSVCMARGVGGYQLV
jgi:hypothetical protein